MKQVYEKYGWNIIAIMVFALAWTADYCPNASTLCTVMALALVIVPFWSTISARLKETR